MKNSEGFMFVYTWMFGFILICVWIDFVDLTGWGGGGGGGGRYAWYEKSFEMVFIMEFDHPQFNPVQLTAVKIQLLVCFRTFCFERESCGCNWVVFVYRFCLPFH